MALSWSVSKPKPNPIAVAIGDVFLFEVHSAASASESQKELESDIEEVVCRAMAFVPEPSDPRAKNALFLWDTVYCSLTLVFTDETLMLDAATVTKCAFEGLDAKMGRVFKEDSVAWEVEVQELSHAIRATVAKIVQGLDLSSLPLSMSMLFSDDDRSSADVEEFVTHKLTV